VSVKVGTGSVLDDCVLILATFYLPNFSSMAPKSGGSSRSAGQRIGEGSIMAPGVETPGASINELANAVRSEMNSDTSGIALGAFEAIAGVLHT
jgi:hypothetical protein